MAITSWQGHWHKNSTNWSMNGRFNNSHLSKSLPVTRTKWMVGNGFISEKCLLSRLIPLVDSVTQWKFVSWRMCQKHHLVHHVSILPLVVAIVSMTTMASKNYTRAIIQQLSRPKIPRSLGPVGMWKKAASNRLLDVHGYLPHPGDLGTYLRALLEMKVIKNSSSLAALDFFLESRNRASVVDGRCLAYKVRLAFFGSVPEYTGRYYNQLGSCNKLRGCYRISSFHKV